MDTTQKVLIGIIVVLGAVLLVTNLDRITGQAQLDGAGAGAESYVPEIVASTTEITVTPSLVTLGDVFSVTVKVGENGCDGKVGIYSPNARVAELQLRDCGDTCTPSEGRTASEEYKAGMDWKAGEYYAAVTDKGSGEQVKAYFTVQ